MDEEKMDLEKRMENFGFALCGIIGRLYDYLNNDYWIGETVPKPVAMAYVEAVDSMLDEGTTTIRCGDVSYDMDELEELANQLKTLW